MKKTLYGFLTFLIWIGILSGCASKSITTPQRILQILTKVRQLH
jgi:hypothetical protein